MALAQPAPSSINRWLPVVEPWGGAPAALIKSSSYRVQGNEERESLHQRENFEVLHQNEAQNVGRGGPNRKLAQNLANKKRGTSGLRPAYE